LSTDDRELWLAFEAEGTDALREIEESLLELEVEPTRAESLNRLYRGLHSLKGNAGFLHLATVERLAHACEDLIGLVRDRGVPFDDEIVAPMLEGVDTLRGMVDAVARKRADLAPEPSDDLVERLRLCFLERGGSALQAPLGAGHLFDEDLPLEQLLAEVTPPAPEPSGAATPPAPASRPASAGRRGEEEQQERADTLRVDAAKISQVMDLAGEIGLACGAVTRHPELEGLDLEGFSAAAHRLELLVRELQNEVSGLRLVPVAVVFRRMRRVVRDAARRTGKQVELVIEGEETEIDKVMVDALQDPLVHLLRNAIDHGLETDTERRQAGKTLPGRLVLNAAHQAGEVTIQVTDDGRGIDEARVLARAKERGLVGADAVLDAPAIHALVFEPGFSTKDKIDELSGRGVGMDVVKTTIEGLRGRVSVRSTPARGSQFTLTMPLTLAFVEAMVVTERERLFALPVERVFEVFQAKSQHIWRSSAEGVVRLRVRDSLIPVVWLHRFWEEQGEFDETLENRLVVVVRTSQGALALPVDRLLGNQQVMLKPLRGPLSRIRAAAGCGMLRSGDVAVTLDCERLGA